jgi:hypothetical protein
VGESLEAPVVFSSFPRFCRISRFVYHPWSHAPGLGTYRCMPVHPSIQARSGPLADATQHSPSSCMPHPTPASRFGIGIFLIESSSFLGAAPAGPCAYPAGNLPLASANVHLMLQKTLDHFALALTPYFLLLESYIQNPSTRHGREGKEKAIGENVRDRRRRHRAVPPEPETYTSILMSQAASGHRFHKAETVGAAGRADLLRICTELHRIAVCMYMRTYMYGCHRHRMAALS